MSSNATKTYATISDAARDMQLFARYDSLRLQTYRDLERLGDRVRIAPMGSATALRFDEVGYFNVVYAPDSSVAGHFPQIESFYAGSPFAATLIGPPDAAAAGIDRACHRRGWTPGKHYAWLCGQISAMDVPVPARASEIFTIREPAIGERTDFLRCYLRAFEAHPQRFAAAIKNMRHLFDRPELSFLCAWKGAEPVGVAMLYRQGPSAVLCAGAVVPEQRERGCHALLLEARIRLAVQHGCTEIFSWATAGGQSQANMERAGLQTVGVSTAWNIPHT